MELRTLWPVVCGARTQIVEETKFSVAAVKHL